MAVRSFSIHSVKLLCFLSFFLLHLRHGGTPYTSARRPIGHPLFPLNRPKSPTPAGELPSPWPAAALRVWAQSTPTLLCTSNDDQDEDDRL